MQYRQSWAEGADWQNFDNHRDVVDPQRREAAFKARRQERFQQAFKEASKRPPKLISTDDAIQRNVGFIVMDYGSRSLRSRLG